MHIDDLILALTRINSGATYIVEDRRGKRDWIYIRRYGVSYRITYLNKDTMEIVTVKTGPLKAVVDLLFDNAKS